MKTVQLLAKAALIVLLTPACGAQIIHYEVGLRFDDGTVLKNVSVGESVTLEVFIQSESAAPRMTEYLVGLSQSAAADSEGLTFTSGEPLAAWTYVNKLVGPIMERYFSAWTADSDHYVTGFPVVVDSIMITATVMGEYVLAPDPGNFDLFAVDAGDVVGNATEMTLASGFGSATLIVIPEPSAAVLSSLLLTGVVAIRTWKRRGRRQT